MKSKISLDSDDLWSEKDPWSKHVKMQIFGVYLSQQLHLLSLIKCDQ